jgi:hypothetical protein
MATTSSTAQASTNGATLPAVLARSRFDVFVDKLHTWEKLPVVHSKNVDTSGAIATVNIRTAQGALLLPAKIFEMTGTPFAGPVNRVLFRDPVSGESAQVDVVMCSACTGCGNQTVSATLPRVHNRDISTTDGRGAVFVPRDPSRSLTSVHRDNNYQMHVFFTGGKRVVVEVDE